MKFTYKAYKKGDNVSFYDKPQYTSDMKALKDGDLFITVDTDTERKSRPQQGYYWSTLVPHTLIILRDECGYVEYKTPEDAHEFLKFMFNPVFKKVVDPQTGEEKQERFPGSTKKMTKEQKMKYIDDIILWAYNAVGYTYPPPKKKSDKYYFS